MNNRKKEDIKLIELFVELNTDYNHLSSKNPFDIEFKTKSKDINKKFLEFISYLYEDYPVKKSLKSLYIQNKLNNYTHYLFILTAQGKSVHKEMFQNILTKKETHILLNFKLDEEFNLYQMIFYSIAKNYGASDSIAIKIAKSKLVNIGGFHQVDKLVNRNGDINKGIFKFNNDVDIHKIKTYSLGDLDLKREYIKFLALEKHIKNKDIKISDIEDVYDFISYKKREDDNFTILGKGYNFKTLIKKNIDWHYELNRMKRTGEYKWDGLDVPNQFINNEDNEYIYTWKFNQILNSKDLQKEGNKMNHCVYSYLRLCKENTCYIFSLSSTTMRKSNHLMNEKNNLTIEIRERQIYQVRGYSNREAKPQEIKAIILWCNKNNIKYPSRF